MPKTQDAATEDNASSNLIGFLKAISVVVCLLHRSGPIPARGALPAMVDAVGGVPCDPERTGCAAGRGAFAHHEAARLQLTPLFNDSSAEVNPSTP